MISAKKTLNSGGNKDISMKQYHLIRILQQFCLLQLFWKKKSNFVCNNSSVFFFQKKTQISYVLRNLTFLRCILVQLCYHLVNRKISKTKPSNIALFQVGHYQLASKRKTNIRVEWMIFFTYYIWVKNNKFFKFFAEWSLVGSTVQFDFAKNSLTKSDVA